MKASRMLDRRNFLLAGSAAAAQGSRRAVRPFCVLQNYYLGNAAQTSRLRTFFRTGLLPALRKWRGTAICLEAIAAEHLPQFMTVLRFHDSGEWDALQANLRADRIYQSAVARWKAGPDGAYERYSEVVLRAGNALALALQASAVGQRGVFELRLEPSHPLAYFRMYEDRGARAVPLS